MTSTINVMSPPPPRTPPAMSAHTHPLPPRLGLGGGTAYGGRGVKGGGAGVLCVGGVDQSGGLCRVGGVGRAGGAAGFTGLATGLTRSSDAPHARQNLVPDGTCAPQFGHTCADSADPVGSGPAHCRQKCAPSRFSAPQLGHLIIHSSRTRYPPPAYPYHKYKARKEQVQGRASVFRRRCSRLLNSLFSLLDHPFEIPEARLGSFGKPKLP
jgi:hypothetical protein